MAITNFNWQAVDFFKRLTATNRLARDKGFIFQEDSSLEGFHDALQSRLPIVAVDDTSDGAMSLDNTPHTKRVKAVFIAMPHAIDDPAARARCMDSMRELFRQFMTKLIREKTKLEEHHLYLDDRITFSEIDKYFFSGMACAYFQISVTTFTDLRLNPDEWLT